MQTNQIQIGFYATSADTHSTLNSELLGFLGHELWQSEHKEGKYGTHIVVSWIRLEVNEGEMGHSKQNNIIYTMDINGALCAVG